MLEDLKTLLDDHQTGMSEFQDDYFVTMRSGGTLYGQYKQSLREVYRRLRGLRELLCDKKILEIEVEEKKIISDDSNEEVFLRRKAEVEHIRKVMQLEEADRVIKDTKREFLRFYQQAITLKKRIGVLTDNKRKELDKDMWMFKVVEMAVFDFIASGRLERSTYEIVTSLPKDMRDKIFMKIKDQKTHNELITWYENREEHISFKELPELNVSIDTILEEESVSMLLE